MEGTFPLVVCRQVDAKETPTVHVRGGSRAFRNSHAHDTRLLSNIRMEAAIHWMLEEREE
jgi:hypothetical protein